MSDIPESTVGTKLKEAGRHSVIYGLGSVVQSGVQFILIPILTGLLTKDGFGAYSLILMVSSVAGAIFYLGMTSAMPRSYYDYESEVDRRSVFTTAFLILAFGAIAQIALGYWGGGIISMVLLHNGQYQVPIAWAFLGSALAFVNQYFFTYLRFQRKSVTSVLFSLVSLAGSIGLSILFLHQSPGDISAAFKAVALAQVAIAVLFLVIFGKRAFTLRLKKAELAHLVPFGMTTVVASFATMLLDWSDRIIIERFVSLADVGVYSAGYKLGSLINVVMIAPFAQIWSPMMMEYRTHSNIKQLFARILSYFLMIGAMVLLASALFMGDFLPVLVRSGVSEQLLPVVLLVMMGYFINGTTNILSAGLFYERKLRAFVYVYYAIAAVKIGANLLVVPTFGILGAAVTTLGAYTLIPVSIYLVSRKYFSFAIDWKRIGLLGALCVLPVVYGLFLWPIFPLWLPFRILWFVLTVGLAYVLCLSPQEKQKLKSIMPFIKKGETL